MSFPDYHRVSFAAAVLNCGCQRLFPPMGNGQKRPDPFFNPLNVPVPVLDLSLVKYNGQDPIAWEYGDYTRGIPNTVSYLVTLDGG